MIPAIEQPFAPCFLAIAMIPKMIPGIAVIHPKPKQQQRIERIPSTKEVIAKPTFFFSGAAV